MAPKRSTTRRRTKLLNREPDLFEILYCYNDDIETDGSTHMNTNYENNVSTN